MVRDKWEMGVIIMAGSPFDMGSAAAAWQQQSIHSNKEKKKSRKSATALSQKVAPLIIN
jgi:hypothetical protein